MSDYFNRICNDYINAEITSVIVNKRSTQEWFNLFTVIELIPSEQEPSPLIKGSQPAVPADREVIDDDYSIYIARVTDFNTNAAIEIFKNPSVGFILQQGTALNCAVKLFPDSYLEQEPPSEHPLIIDKQTEHTFGTVLPFRHTDFRLWAKIDRQKKWFNTFSPSQKETIVRKSGLLSMRHLGFDLARMPEHFGNIYLCGCNPFLRKYDCKLLDYNRDLLISFYERDAKTIIGNKLVLEEKRAGNMGFCIEKIISNKNERILLPHFPDNLYTKIYDANGFLIENHLGTWINFSFGMQIQTSVLNLTVKEGDTTKTIEVPKYSAERPVTVGKYDNSLAYYLKDQQRNKEIEELENNKEFIFFPGGKTDKEKAQNVIGEIINRAKERCMFLDPYFGAGDLLYAYILKNTSLPIQIISSSAFLKDKISGDSRITHADRLYAGLTEFQKKFPYQKIECRVLKGRDKSPLHDRYIVIDNSAYLLGSSFNEFGSRATTLTKAPAPELLIQKAIDWWSNDDESIPLEEYINSKKVNDESKNSVGIGAKIFQPFIDIYKRLFIKK
ncbi:MAG: hypothetical protein J0I09_03135 [Sphingobacteriia bacterium]|nr:hypothetical protein [Sphingobacteriia bacterium]